MANQQTARSPASGRLRATRRRAHPHCAVCSCASPTGLGQEFVLQPDGSYHMKGEYVTSDQFRTQIEARIWLHSKEAPSTDESQENEEEE